MGERGPLRAVSTLACSSRGCSSTSLSSSCPASLVTTNTGTGGVSPTETSFSDNLLVQQGMCQGVHNNYYNVCMYTSEQLSEFHTKFNVFLYLMCMNS